MTTSPAPSPTPSTGGGGGNSDPWALASGPSYDPEKIYTRASDDKGHSALMHVKVSTTLHGEIRALVESRAISELRTHADIVRDALIHRMVQYRDMLKAKGVSTGTITSTINTEIREAQLDAIAHKHAHWENLIDKLDGRLAECIRLGDYDTAWYLVDQNHDPEDMTAPFVKRLEDVLSKHTAVLRSISDRLPLIGDVPYDSNVTRLRR